MRQFLIIITFVFSFGPKAQTQPYSIKFSPVDSSKSLFYCPGYKIRISHLIEGVGNLYKPADSISKRVTLSRYWNLDSATEQAIIIKSNISKINFSIIVDTSHYSERAISFFKLGSNKIFSTHYPGQIKSRDQFGNYKVEEVLKDTIINFLSQPVLIANLSDSVLYLIANQGRLYLTQQAKNKRGKWVDIETTRVSDDCAWLNYVYELKQHDFILTQVMRFSGDYKTQLRIKLLANERIIFSEPYIGSIDYNQIIKAEGK
jgi:hypothetical protein